MQVKQGKDVPYFYNDNAYSRNDTSTIKVDIPELKRLILKGQNIDYDSLTSKNQSLSFEI